MLSLIVVGLLGCDEKKHYRTLSFFFDGVPVPKELQTPAQREASQQQTAQQTNKSGAAEKPIVYFYHDPYIKRNCFSCHDSRQGNDVSMQASTCIGCHAAHVKTRDDDWVHGPVRIEGCGLCHEPHRSENKHLLSQSQPDLCFQCHNESILKDSAMHATLEDLTCSRCHDPHAAGNRLLLADSRTYRLRSGTAKPPTTGHDLWQRDTCTQCHQLDAANQLIDNVEAQCITCHAQTPTQTAAHPMHAPVAQAKCLTCHTPHRTPRPRLLRPGAEQICLSCHLPDARWNESHPNMNRVDCIICHTGHQSDREHLLREGASLPNRPPASLWDPAKPTEVMP